MERNKTIDIARGIAIILMCIGHANCPDILQKFVSMFHMAFFFVISGYFFNKEKTFSQPWNFIIKKIKGLYIPFITWGIIFTFLHNVFLNLKLLGPNNHYYGIKETLWKAFTTNTRFIPTEEMMVPYWFFACLFYVSIFSMLLFFISNRLSKKKWIECLIFLLAYVIGFILLYTKNGNSYDYIIRTFIISFLFYLGYLWYHFKDKIQYNGTGLILSIIILIAGLFSSYNTINIALLELENPLIFLVYSVSGTYMLLNISKYIENHTSYLKSFLSYTGSKTLIILLCNCLCIRVFNLLRVYIEKYTGYPTTIFTHNSDWYWWILYTAFMIIVPLTLNWSYHQMKKLIFK